GWMAEGRRRSLYNPPCPLLARRLKNHLMARYLPQQEIHHQRRKRLPKVWRKLSSRHQPEKTELSRLQQRDHHRVARCLLWHLLPCPPLPCLPDRVVRGDPDFLRKECSIKVRIWLNHRLTDWIA